MGGEVMGAIAPPLQTRVRKIFLNVSENKSSARKFSLTFCQKLFFKSLKNVGDSYQQD